jgi:hypothetical protein
MRHDWIHFLWAAPLGVLLVLWAAFIVIAIKGLLFHREPRREIPSEWVDPETGAVMRPAGMGFGCSLCVIVICWPLLVADMIDKWLPPPQGK